MRTGAPLATRLTAEIAVATAMKHSKMEPHRIFYVAAIRCPGCHRHVSGCTIFVADSAAEPKPKYWLATVIGGEIITRLTPKH